MPRRKPTTDTHHITPTKPEFLFGQGPEPRHPARRPRRSGLGPLLAGLAVAAGAVPIAAHAQSIANSGGGVTVYRSTGSQPWPVVFGVPGGNSLTIDTQIPLTPGRYTVVAGSGVGTCIRCSNTTDLGMWATAVQRHELTVEWNGGISFESFQPLSGWTVGAVEAHSIFGFQDRTVQSVGIGWDRRCAGISIESGLALILANSERSVARPSNSSVRTTATTFIMSRRTVPSDVIVPWPPWASIGAGYAQVYTYINLNVTSNGVLTLNGILSHSQSHGEVSGTLGDDISNPYMPVEFCEGGGEFQVFIGRGSPTAPPPPPVWYDPPTSGAFRFNSIPGLAVGEGVFTQIADFPPGFAQPFEVVVGNVILGQFVPGQAVAFADHAAALGSLLLQGDHGRQGVSAFEIRGITPLDTPNSPMAFPIKLDFDRGGTRFTMREARPELVVTAPSSATICPQGSATFQIAATGLSSISYQWQMADNGSPGGWRDLTLGANNIPCTVGACVMATGVHTPTLVLAGGDSTCRLSACLSGRFVRCVITADNAGEISDSATLTICVADADDGSGTGTCDGGVTIDDLLYYLFAFEAGDLNSDVDDSSATGTPDGGVTIDDLLYYLQRFEAGC